MIQIINLIIVTTILLSVMYLFTCGQSYMKMSVNRARRSYFIERLSYVALGVFSVAEMLYRRECSNFSLLLDLSICLHLLLKCHSVYKHIKHKK